MNYFKRLAPVMGLVLLSGCPPPKDMIVENYTRCGMTMQKYEKGRVVKIDGRDAHHRLFFIDYPENGSGLDVYEAAGDRTIPICRNFDRAECDLLMEMARAAYERSEKEGAQNKISIPEIVKKLDEFDRVYNNCRVELTPSPSQSPGVSE